MIKGGFFAEQETYFFLVDGIISIAPSWWSVGYFEVKKMALYFCQFRNKPPCKFPNSKETFKVAILSEYLPKYLIPMKILRKDVSMRSCYCSTLTSGPATLDM